MSWTILSTLRRPFADPSLTLRRPFADPSHKLRASAQGFGSRQLLREQKRPKNPINFSNGNFNKTSLY